MIHQFEAHRRYPDEIGNSLFLDQPERLGSVPLGHQDHGAGNDKAVEHYRHFAGHVEQRYDNQGFQRVERRATLRFEDAPQHHEAGGIGINAGCHRAVRRHRTLGLTGGAGCKEDSRIVVGRDLRQVHVFDTRCNKLEKGFRAPLIDRNRVDGTCHASPRDALSARSIGQDQLGLGQLQRMLKFVRLPPAIEQRRDRAGLHRCHVGQDPRRAVAHRNADPVSLADPSRNQPSRQLIGQHVKFAEGQRRFVAQRRQQGR